MGVELSPGWSVTNTPFIALIVAGHSLSAQESKAMRSDNIYEERQYLCYFAYFSVFCQNNQQVELLPFLICFLFTMYFSPPGPPSNIPNEVGQSPASGSSTHQGIIYEMELSPPGPPGRYWTWQHDSLQLTTAQSHTALEPTGARHCWTLEIALLDWNL